MSWMDLANSAINAAVQREQIKATASATAAGQQAAVSQPQVSQVVPQQDNVSGARAVVAGVSPLLLLGGGGALLLGVILLMRK
ncbi:MAG: hypothetical protein IBX50_13940 [Marinospirillum sp.]|uniref:hypothetical protein n=1 Tax=Marinospirillum sp. TaxID=2183934 RepID=UPI0019E099E3|nr:hypothetical protein [Marinospirillum sp.]MBE0507788.1 hypothetical protein [Marinospirillum sp.]